jgi:branched-chain amino acid transport system substrate-binding protein
MVLRSESQRLKAVILFTVIFLLTLALVILIGKSAKENTLYLALAAPMTGPYHLQGEEMRKGSQMYLDEVNSQGGINGKHLELLLFDDQGIADLAEQAALEIAQNDQILAVLGHYFSTPSIHAGKIYKKYGIPAVTGTAIAQEVTENNDWYFQTTFNSHQEGVFMANYAKKILNYSKVAIVYAPDLSYSNSVTQAFEKTFTALGGDVIYKVVYDFKKDLQDQADKIARHLSPSQDQTPDFIFLSLREIASIKFTVAIKRREIPYPILGDSSLGGGASIVELLSSYPEEQAQPGYFSDGIYATSPLIFDIVGEQGQIFKNKFIQKYQNPPGWTEANSYEATKVVVEAIAKTSSKSQNVDIKTQRKKIRDYLKTINSLSNAVQGVNGPIYFNTAQRAATKLIAMGVYENQAFISALTQLIPEHDDNQSGAEVDLNYDQKDRTLVVGNRLMHKTNIVYTGIEVNGIRNINQKNSSFTIDFNLWFRFSPTIDADNIEFINYDVVRLDSGQPLQLREPVEERILSETEIYRLYRMKADFQGNFQFEDYPFDQQVLSVQFRHAYLPRQDLIYVVDTIGMGDLSYQAILEKFKISHVFEAIADWDVKDVNFFSDTIIQASSLGKEEYSRFNVIIDIRRKALIFSLKNLLPLFFLVILSYLILFLPFDLISVEAVSGALLAVVFFHLSLIQALPDGVGYVVALDYAFYIVYVLIILQLLMVVTGHRIMNHHNQKLLKNLLIGSRIAYVSIIWVAALFFSYHYELIGTQSFEPTPEPTLEPQAPLITYDPEFQFKPEVTTLTLASIQVDSRKQMQQFLDLFHIKYPQIEVRFVPIQPFEYPRVLPILLERGIAPDLFLVYPFNAGRALYRSNYLTPLQNEPLSQKDYDPAVLQDWSSEEGELYAVPIVSIVRGLYYNIDLLEKLNLKVPQTWSELLANAQVLKAAGYIPFANGSRGSRMIMDQLFMSLAANFIGGAEGREAYLTGKRCFNDAATIAALEALRDLRPFLPKNADRLSYFDSLYLFAEGQAAMWFNGSWSTGWLEREAPRLNWSIFAVPAPRGKPTYVSAEPSIGIGLNRASLHQAAAKVFLQWLSSPEAAEQFATKLPGFLPLNQQPVQIKSKHAQQFLTLTQKYKTDLGWGTEMTENGVLSGYSLLAGAAKQVLNGRMTPIEAADYIQEGLAQWFEPAQTCSVSANASK